MTGLVRHLHAFVRETEPTMDEWAHAIDFLTRTGQKCDDKRQEFILLSDVLGVSMLLETINSRKTAGAPGVTAATVLGPFHLVASPRRELGDSIDLVGGNRPCVITGQVRDTLGAPLPGARVDVWQWDEQGFYDVQQPDSQPPGNGRGLFAADGEGRFWFRTVVPSHYPVPTDGPVAEMLRATRRDTYRPAHIHFLVTAPEHHPVTTHFFVAGSRYLDSDAVFAVKQSLVREFSEINDPGEAGRYGVPVPFWHATTDVVLQPVAACRRIAGRQTAAGPGQRTRAGASAVLTQPAGSLWLALGRCSRERVGGHALWPGAFPACEGLSTGWCPAYARIRRSGA